MRVKTIVDEDFINYKKPSMFIATCTCDFKCCREQGLDISICQNSNIANQPNIEVSDEAIYRRYIDNKLTNAIVIGGLEPFKQADEIISLIKYFRQRYCTDDIVIYTGYEPQEVEKYVQEIKRISLEVGSIYIKYGRFIPNQNKHYDPILGVNLISDNQRGAKIC